jgi:hypothetical protein
MKTDLLPRKPGEIGGIACIRASSQYRTNFTEAVMSHGHPHHPINSPNPVLS